MALPRKTLSVLPNPWSFIHHELGPQATCLWDNGGRGGYNRFVGAELDRERSVVIEKRDEGDPRQSRSFAVFAFPSLDASFLKPAKDGAVEVPKTPYFFDRLRDGDLIPVDDATREAGTCRFKNLAEAKEAGVAEFESHHGKGSYAELEKYVADQAKARAEAKPSEPAKAEPKADGGKK